MQVESLLSKKDVMRYDAFLESLKLLSKGVPYLAIIACDTPKLGEAIQQDLQQRIPDLRIPSPPQQADDFHRVFKSAEDSTILLSLYEPLTTPDEQLAAQLLFYRDSSISQCLNTIVLVSETLLDTIHREAFDLISAASYTHGFRDQAISVAKDFQPTQEKPQEVVEYEKAVAAYKTEKRKWFWKRSNRAMMKRAFETGLKAYDLSQNTEALVYYREALKFAKRLKDTDYESAALGNIGLIYRIKGELEEALKYHKEALVLHKKIGYLQGEANQLGNIGLIYSAKGELEEALKYHKEALQIDRQIGYLQGEANQLGNIGLIYSAKGELEEALKYHKEALVLNKKVGYLQGEATQLGNIGLIYSDKGELEEALKYHKEALQIDRQIGYLQGEANQLGNIGLIYSA
ncbi:MAG: tetratricopeptide repeat protein, partial [Chitinophagales bacterium]|nr:tetratricopeptide repeat protein [Chitinophagales bacterium]